MKNFWKFLVLLGLIPALLLTGCKKDSDTTPTLSEFDQITQYLVQNNLDLPAVASGFTTSGSKLTVNADNSVDGYVVIDLRNQAAFDNGHIKGAIRSDLKDVLDVAANAGADKKFLVVCYSGQTAARAVAALRLMSYNAVSLKWGMSAWHSDFASTWDNKVATLNNPNWVKTGTPAAVQEFGLPVIVTNELTVRAMLEARVRAMLNNSAWSVSNTDVLANPGNYFINNKWPQASFDTYGHIMGAYRIDEDLKIANLKNFDPSKVIVNYCYTGQTSAITSAWMEVLGYNAKSLSFGVNAINYDELKVGTVDAANTKSWRGEGSGSVTNKGYVDGNGNQHGPN